MFKNKILIILILSFLVLIGIYYISTRSTSEKISSISEDVSLYEKTNNSSDEINNNGIQGRGKSKGDCLSDDCLSVNNLEYPVSELPDEVVDSLIKALDDEYKAFSTYDAIIKRFGNIRPFIMIIRAEEQHITSLKSIFDKYAVDIPDNPYLGKIESPESVSNACSIGVQAEIDNAALYKDELLPSVIEYEDITSVFTNLMNASQEKHLPAFERCSN